MQKVRYKMLLSKVTLFENGGTHNHYLERAHTWYFLLPLQKFETEQFQNTSKIMCKTLFTGNIIELIV